MRKFILLYDCPIKKCDKMWLYNGLKKYGDVKLIKTGVNITYFRLSRMFPKLKLGALMTKILIYIQSMKALIVSKKEDIIVTWSQQQGLILNELCEMFKIKRKIVSFCWINLPKKKYFKKVKKCLTNENFIPIINSTKLEKDLKELFNLPFWNGLYLPDVYNDMNEWSNANFNKEGKYVFAGGVNNRDWDTLISVAKETPEIHYIIVTGKNDIINKPMLNNVEYYEELPSKDYYNFMEKSFITVAPLKEDKVAGLINLIKSIQYGIPCIATNLEVTSIYYPKDMDMLLYEINNKESLKKRILNCYSLSEKEYKDIILKLQNHLKNNFTPTRNIEKLIKKLEEKN